MDTSKIRQDWEQGKPVDVGLLLDTIDRLTQALAEASKKLDEAVRKIDQLTKSKKLEEPYSVNSHERREEATQGKRKSKKNRNRKNPLGRKRNQAKLALAT